MTGYRGVFAQGLSAAGSSTRATVAAAGCQVTHLKKKKCAPLLALFATEDLIDFLNKKVKRKKVRLEPRANHVARLALACPNGETLSTRVARARGPKLPSHHQTLSPPIPYASVPLLLDLFYFFSFGFASYFFCFVLLLLLVIDTHPCSEQCTMQSTALFWTM